MVWNTPSRVHEAASAADPREGVKLYRNMMAGDVSILLMDSRLYRSKQPCKRHAAAGLHRLPAGKPDPAGATAGMAAPELSDPQPRWTLLANQIRMSRIAVGNSGRPWG